MSTRRNRIGAISLACAAAGFLFVTLQPWIPLDRVLLFDGLTLKTLLASFFEASLVGSLADWFAVSALFTNPLGLPLPHTDILAKNKDAIAEAVPRFLTSFVSEEAVAAELVAIDFAGKLEKAMGEGTTREEIHDFVRRRLSSLLAGVAPAGDGATPGLAVFVKELFAFLSQKLDPAVIVASVIRWAREGGFDEKAVETVAELMRTEIGKNLARIAGFITPLLKRNAGWQGIFVGQGTVEKLLGGVQNELAQVRSNPRHELRRFLASALDSTAARLSGEASDPAGHRDRVRAAVLGALGDAAFQSRFARFVADLLGLLAADVRRAQGGFFDGVDRIEIAFFTRLSENRDFRARFNRGVAGLISGLIARSRLIESLTGYLSTLLKNTDEREFVRRVEGAVWNDLQYIRVNGAMVGGLVGLALAVISALARR
jgi:uncharacterized membrane-anchored protein YjiN (DUF445 family)